MIYCLLPALIGCIVPNVLFVLCWSSLYFPYQRLEEAWGPCSRPLSLSLGPLLHLLCLYHSIFSLLLLVFYHINPLCAKAWGTLMISKWINQTCCPPWESHTHPCWCSFMIVCKSQGFFFLLCFFINMSLNFFPIFPLYSAAKRQNLRVDLVLLRRIPRGRGNHQMVMMRRWSLHHCLLLKKKMMMAYRYEHHIYMNDEVNLNHLN